VIEGIIKPKDKARKEYKDNVEAGNTAAIAEISDSSPDVMKISIGNIPPNTEIDIEFSYIDKIELSMLKFRKFTLPATLTPRYHPKPVNDDQITLATYPTVTKKSDFSYPWKVTLTMICDQEITFVKSPSHPDIQIKKEEASIMSLILPDKYRPNKDLTIFFSTGNPL
jgi:hypothetical protein